MFNNIPTLTNKETIKNLLTCFGKSEYKIPFKKTTCTLNEKNQGIISIAKQRCETGRFYINADSLPQSALFQLKQDEILGYDDTHCGYFITHDIYEEWTLNKICFPKFFQTHQPQKSFLTT